MTVSLKNIDLQGLSTCDLKKEIIAIDGEQKIIRIAKDQITPWQYFLRSVGLGVLANTKLHLTEVSAHLNKYDWSESIDASSPQHQAYLNVCILANKLLFSKRDGTLYRNVGSEQQISILFLPPLNPKQTSTRPERGNRKDLVIYWNPHLQVKHLRTMLTPDFSPSSQMNTVLQIHYPSGRPATFYLDENSMVPKRSI